jgi:hypothetical protein
VKSPVELVVGTLRALDLRPESGTPFAIAASGMSQALFAPPNVKGWPGGEAWINSTTLLARKQFLAALARPARNTMMDDDAPAVMQPAAGMGDVATDETARRLRAARSVERALARLRFAPDAWLSAQPGADVEARFAAAQRVLLPLPPASADVAEARAQRDPALFVRAALLDPVYELR